MRCEYCGDPLDKYKYTEIPAVRIEEKETKVRFHRVCDYEYCRNGMRREIELQEAVNQRYK